jgi:hypothetical protein
MDLPKNVGIVMPFIDSAMEELRCVDKGNHSIAVVVSTVREAIKQLVAAQTLIKFFNSELTDATIDDVCNDLHTGYAVVNGRMFRVASPSFSHGHNSIEIKLTLLSKGT